MSLIERSILEDEHVAWRAPAPSRYGFSLRDPVRITP
jgi:hypothetical protein